MSADETVPDELVDGEAVNGELPGAETPDTDVKAPDTDADTTGADEDFGRKRGANTSNEFHKKEVVDKSVKYVGRVENIFFDPHDWSVTHLAVKLDREICKVYGLSKMFAKTCYLPVEMVETVGDRLLLNVTIDVIIDKSEIA